MSKLSRKEKKERLVRVLAIVLAVLLIGTIVASTLPVFTAFAEAETPKNRYDLTMNVDLQGQTVTVTERLDYVNTSGRSLDCVMFTLYANLFRRAEALPIEDDDWNDAFPAGYAPGGVVFSEVRVNGEAVDWSVSGDYEQFLRVPCALEDGGRAEFEMTFLLLPVNGRWGTGVGETDWRLVSFYPAAAVYDANESAFVLNNWTAVTDPMMGDPADFTVTLTLDEAWTAASTGTAVSEPDGHGQRVWTITARDARDFSLALIGKTAVCERTLESGLVIRAYAASSLTARAMAENAALVTAQYEEWFGAALTDELELVEADVSDPVTRPGLILIPRGLGRLTARGELEKTIASLCAGQWFGGCVGCNPSYEPWMNDTLSLYASLMYFDEREGRDDYLKRLNETVLESLQITIPGGLTVDSDAERFTSRAEYELVVKDRGAAVLHEMRELMGKDDFIAGLRRYIEANRGKIASVEQFASAFNEVTGARWDEYIVGQMHTISDYVNERIEWFE